MFDASNPCTRIQVMSTCSQGLVSFFLPQSVQCVCVCVCVLCVCCVCGCREWCIVGWNKMRADRSWRKTLVTHGEAAEQPMESRSMQQRGGEQPGKSREHRDKPTTYMLIVSTFKKQLSRSIIWNPAIPHPAGEKPHLLQTSVSRSLVEKVSGSSDLLLHVLTYSWCPVSLPMLHLFVFIRLDLISHTRTRTHACMCWRGTRGASCFWSGFISGTFCCLLVQKWFEPSNLTPPVSSFTANLCTAQVIVQFGAGI